MVNPAGLDVAALRKTKGDGSSVGEYRGSVAIGRDELYDVDCDILVPAARPDVLTAANAGDVRARLMRRT